MRYVEKFMNTQGGRFLELTVYDSCDEEELSLYRDETNVTLGLDMLPYLCRLPKAENIIITPGELGEAGFEPLYELNPVCLKLEYENDDDPEYSIDLSRLSRLQLLFSRSSRNFTNITGSPSLRTLITFDWQNEDLSVLAGTRIDSLQITGGRLRALDGAEKMPCLSALSLCRLKKLTDISALSAVPALKYLEFDCCSSVRSFAGVSLLHLEAFVWLGYNRIGSLDLLPEMPSLSRILLEVTVEDGCLDRLMNLQHAAVICGHRRHSVKNSELPKLTVPYTISTIPPFRAVSLPLCISESTK